MSGLEEVWQFYATLGVGILQGFNEILFLQKVIDDLEKLRSILAHPSSLQLFMAADADKLQPNALKIVTEKLLPPAIKDHATKE